jgi:hypothetical protein
MKDTFDARRSDVSNEMKTCDDETREKLKKKIKQITESLLSFEKTNHKNNILREVSDLIYNPEFVDDMNKEVMESWNTAWKPPIDLWQSNIIIYGNNTIY